MLFYLKEKENLELAKSQSKYKNIMSKEGVLTKEIAEQFIEDEYSVDLCQFTEINDEAALGGLLH